MSDSFATATAPELLAALETAGRTPPLELIRACMSRRHDLTPGLLDMLATPPDENWAEDDPRWYAPVHAGHLLIFFREPEAIPTFIQILRDTKNEYLSEWFSLKLASYGLGILSPLSDLLNDPAASLDAHMGAVETLKQIAAEFPTERTRVSDILRKALPTLDKSGALVIPTLYPGKPNIHWTVIAATLADLSDFMSRQQIEAMYREKWIDETIMGSQKDYVASLLNPIPLYSQAFNLMETYEALLAEDKSSASWDKNSITELQRQLHELNAQNLTTEGTDNSELVTDTVMPELDDTPTPTPLRAAARRSTSTSRAVPKPTPQPIRRETPKIGRNDPCFCGSGRKYKHCHGKS